MGFDGLFSGLVEPFEELMVHVKDGPEQWREEERILREGILLAPFREEALRGHP